MLPHGINRHHYFFAHCFLRQLAFTQPVETLSNLASNGRDRFITDLLQKMEEIIPGSDPCGFTAADIAYSGEPIGDRPCAILQMPPPGGPTEAYFIAIVGRRPMDQLYALSNNPGEEVLIDYYTLERPVEVTKNCRSVFCGWTTKSHLNFGDGPEPTLENFRSAVAERLQKDEARPSWPSS